MKNSTKHVTLMALRAEVNTLAHYINAEKKTVKIWMAASNKGNPVTQGAFATLNFHRSNLRTYEDRMSKVVSAIKDIKYADRKPA